MAFDPAAATAAYINSLGAPALAKAADYTVGGEWMILWNLVVVGLVTWIGVKLGIMPWLAQRLDKRGNALRNWVMTTAWLLVSSLLMLPWDIYAGWWRELSYGRTSQPFGDFFGQFALSVAISSVLIGLFFVGIYALIRRAGRRWWLWSGGLAAFGVSAILLLGPILIEPLFNSYRPVPHGPVRSALETMADRAHIPHDRIFMYDGSRQSNNFTANVSGVLGSARIAISDVALDRASLDEVRAVTGHEIGHYVLGHAWRMVAVFSLLAIALFFLADRVFPWLSRAFGANVGIDDPVGFPVLMFLISLCSVLAMPITNSLIRYDEAEADAYSLRTENLPDALASALVKTAEYRYPRPGPIEEVIFYDHPSVERRVRTAMEWKATHPPGTPSAPAR